MKREQFIFKVNILPQSIILFEKLKKLNEHKNN